VEDADRQQEIARHYDLGYFDDETCRLEPIEIRSAPKVLPRPEIGT
jgi:hypothetical protein